MFFVRGFCSIFLCVVLGVCLLLCLFGFVCMVCFVFVLFMFLLCFVCCFVFVSYFFVFVLLIFLGRPTFVFFHNLEQNFLGLGYPLWKQQVTFV